ncbi:MAG: DUF2752 domain-containing protein [Planctomycetota bacterium]|jgi:hypothetical protein
MSGMQTSLPVPIAAVEGDRTGVRRLVGALVASGAAALLALASWFAPAEAGLGTHEQLNLPACGWIMTMDLPCPTCGMTTAFAHAADGSLVGSFLAQPLGCLLAIATAMALLVGAYVAVTGSAVAGSLRRLWQPRTPWLLAGVALFAWIFKVATYKELL